MSRVSDDPAALLDLARALAVEAGDLVRAGRERGPVAAMTKSTDTDMVTEFDRASEQLIVQRLREVRPDDAIRGEEGADTPGTSGIEWIIDPIDGTTNFMYGLPTYNVSVAARDGDGPLIGAVMVPGTGELFSARRGGGASCNGRPVRCSDTTELAKALVATGFSYRPEQRTLQAARVARIIGHIRDIRRLGAAAADLAFTAAGRLDAFYEEHLNAWDLAAGEVIAREAGCRLGGLDGGPVRPESVLVATPAVFDALLELIADSGAPDLTTPTS